MACIRPVCLAAVLSGCTSFATLRSADVRPGASFLVQASLAASPGDEAGWFWSIDCASQCNHAISALDLGVSFGARSTGAPPMAFGFGLNGLNPYLDAYLQLSTARKLPFGVGARLGLPLDSWSEHQVYGRLDLALGPDVRLLLNPGLFYHTGHSPNDQNPGSFLGLVQGVGIEFSDGPIAIIPGLAFVWGRAERTSYGEQIGPAYQAFVTASVGIVFRRKPGP